MLRDVTEEDLPIFFEHQREPEALRMAAFRPRERDDFMLHWRTKVMGNPTGRALAIVVDGRVAGNILSWGADGVRLVGYWVGREYWGRGVATAALSEFLLLEGTRPLCAYVAVHNRGSIRVLQKCGFRQVGGIRAGPDGVEEYLFELARALRAQAAGAGGGRRSEDAVPRGHSEDNGSVHTSGAVPSKISMNGAAPASSCSGGGLGGVPRGGSLALPWAHVEASWAPRSVGDLGLGLGPRHRRLQGRG